MSSDLVSSALDANGHFPGCATQGCEATRCRDARERRARGAGLVFDLRRSPDPASALPPETAIADMARKIHATGGTPSALPIGQSFALTGRWRVYFNRHGAAGRPWCIAPEVGGWEVAVSSVGISTVAETVYHPKATPDDEDGRPSAWIAVDGHLTVHVTGHASIGVP